MTDEITLDSVVVAIKEQVSADLGGETVVLGLPKGEYYGMEGAGNDIWNLLQEPRSVSDIRDELLARYEVDAGVLGPDILEFLTELRREGLIEVTGGKAP